MTAPFTTLISPADFGDISSAGSCRVFDARFSLAAPQAGRQAYLQGHIPGAIYVDLNRDLSAPVVPGRTGRHPLPSVEAFAEQLRGWGVNPGEQVVVYDAGDGAIAARMWWMCRWLGHDEVAVLDGGYAAWMEQGGATDQAIVQPLRGGFLPRVRQELVADLDDVFAGKYVLLDARARPRFRGDEEPIDPVAGHIPGARCLPYGELLRDGRLLPREDLARVFAPLFRRSSDSTSAAYCGSGVTACQLVLAACHAGWPSLKLYPGSFSEWITDPRRPVASGDE